MKKVKTNKKQAKRNRKINTRALLLVVISILLIVLLTLIYLLFAKPKIEDVKENKAKEVVIETVDDEGKKIDKIEVKPIDTSALEDLIKNSNTFDRNAYTAESVAAYDEVIAEAQKLIDSKKASKEEVQAAYNKVMDAIFSLVHI